MTGLRASCGTTGDGCYLLDEGVVRLEIERPEIDTDGVLGYLEPGMVLGEFSLLDGLPRSSSAYAHTAVVAQWLAVPAVEALCAEHPALGLRIMKALGEHVVSKLHRSNRRLAEYIFADESDPAVDDIVSRAVAVQHIFEGWPEARVDALLRDIATAIADHAEELAIATVAETGIGHVPDKVLKNRFASLDVYDRLAGKPAFGLLETKQQHGVTEIATPVGVVFGLIPMTNPVATLVLKTLICLKGCNALILSCHRNALKVGTQTGEIIQTVLRTHGASARSTPGRAFRTGDRG